jgi:hypothetical protein
MTAEDGADHCMTSSVPGAGQPAGDGVAAVEDAGGGREDLLLGHGLQDLGPGLTSSTVRPEVSAMP